MFASTLGSQFSDDVVHIVEVSLAPIIILAAIAMLLTVFARRLACVADKVSAAIFETRVDTSAEARVLSLRLIHLRRRFFRLAAAVILAGLGGALTFTAILMLFVGELRDTSATSVLLACFGAALVSTIGAIGMFLSEFLMAAREERGEVELQQD